MKTILSILLVLIGFNLNLFSQSTIQNDSTLNLLLRNRSREISLSDSIQSPFLTVFFDKDMQTIQLTNNFKIWIEADNYQVFPTLLEKNICLFDSLKDKFTICFLFEHDTLRFNNIEYRVIKYGAKIKFGICNKLDELKRHYKKNENNRDFIHQPYADVIQNEMYKKRKTYSYKGMNFIIIEGKIPGKNNLVMSIVRFIPNEK